MENQVLRVVAFQPFAEGEVRDLTRDDFREVVGGSWEMVACKDAIEDVVVISNEDAIDLGFKRNRGYWGTFLVVKENEEGNFVSLNDKEIAKIKKVLDTKKTFSSSNKFMERFFEEKDLTPVIFSYERENNFITLSNYDIIEALLASKNRNLLKQAEMMLRKIDFANADVNHFLEHLGNDMADQIAKANKDCF